MTDRVISYAGALPRVEDFLSISKFAMIGDGAVAEALLGQTTQVAGLAATALPNTAVAGDAFAVSIGRGFLFSFQETDPNAYGVLGSDTSTNTLKIGILSSGVEVGLTNAAPGTAGQSVNYLISAAFLEQDINSVVLPYYNAASPTQPFSGPANNSTAQVTARQDTIQFEVTAGAAAATGSQATPAPPAGYVPLYVVTVTYGQTSVIGGNISIAPGAPFIASGTSGKLLNVQTFKTVGTHTYTPTPGTTFTIFEVVGAGGAGGAAQATTSSQVSCASGGQGGPYSKTKVASPTPMPIVIGDGGAGGPGDGAAGGTTTVGSILTVPGGNGGKQGIAGTGSYAYGGHGAIGTTANIVDAPGQAGTAGNGGDVGGSYFSGAGGGSPYGSGGIAVSGSSNSGANGIGYGAAGGGACNGPSSSLNFGGNGTNAIVIAHDYS